MTSRARSGDPPQGYYGLPLFKPPVWTWEVPAYFLVGGAAGAAAAVAAVARASAAPAGLVTHARWIAAAGGAMSPVLLVSDLGRPERFLNMLRVFKPQSPMSVGAWTLVVFSNAAAATILADVAQRRSQSRSLRVTERVVETIAAATGVVVATYTGVLLGATAIPVWARHAGLLPLHFGASGLGTAVSLLELMGHREMALRRLAIGAAAVEMLAGAVVEADWNGAAEPLKRGRSGRIARAGGALAGPLPLVLRLAGRRSSRARLLAAFATVVGAALTRVGWVAAGRARQTHATR